MATIIEPTKPKIIMQYNEFLENKIKLTKKVGFNPDPSLFHESTKPHQKDALIFHLNMGRSLDAEKFGLGKTQVQIEYHKAIHRKIGGKHLIVAPFSPILQFTNIDGPRLGVQVIFVNKQSQIDDIVYPEDECKIYITNYETIMLGKLNLIGFTSVSLDEGNVLRNLDSKTTDALTRYCKEIPFRMVASATPDPNEYLELINYAHFLGVMDRGQAMTRFFQRDSQKAGNLQLHPDHTTDFWLFVMSFAFFLDKPSTLGYSDEGYALPSLVVRHHIVQVPNDNFGKLIDKKTGNIRLMADGSGGIVEESKIKKASIKERMAKAMELLAEHPKEHAILWHLLEDERKYLHKILPEAKDVFGKQDRKERENRIMGFTNGEFQYLSTKPEITAEGCNFQHHCHWSLFTSINHKFDDFIQSVHRVYRFLLKEECWIDIIYCEQERNVVQNLMAKWKRYDEQNEIMSQMIKEYGLHQKDKIAALKRSFVRERQDVNGEHFRLINNDNVLEMPKISSNSIGLHFTSVPFGNHYEYTSLYNDFGHNENDDKFFEQMDFLLPEVYRTLQPGRNLVIHVKDRILYGYQNGYSMYSVNPFSDKTVNAVMKHGFVYMGRRTIKTDVVRENNQTYRLGWSECCKDSSKMGCGSPEYLLCFRKPQTSKQNSYADIPVTKEKKDYSRAAWQVDADSFWRSSGDRLISPEDLKAMSHKKIMAWWKEHNLTEPYNHKEHILFGETLEAIGRLPASFTLLGVHSYDEYVWTDINYMNGLNTEQIRRKAQAHICPLPFDIVDRVIDLFSNKGDTVCDFFAGLGTVPLRAVKAGRKGLGIELNPVYFKWAVTYIQEAERMLNAPTLMDFIETEMQKENAEV